MLYTFVFVCLFVNSGFQHILFCVFKFFVFVLFLLYPILPVSLGCPFLIVPLGFSNVYLLPFRFFHPKNYHIKHKTNKI